MAALLDQLDREHGWRRLRWAMVVAAIGALAIGALANGALRSRDPLAACDGGVAEIAEVWNPGHAARIRATLDHLATPYARAIGAPIVAALDGYRDRWSSMHRAACRDYRAVRLSAERFDRRMQCLERRRQDLASTVEVLGETTASSVDRAVDAAARLPPVEPCAQLDVLPDAIEPPATAAGRDAVAAIRTQLSRADALDRSGRSADALAVADRAVEAAQRVAHPAAVIDAALTKGRILLGRFAFSAAVAPLTLAEQLALTHRQLATAVIAGARRIYAEGATGVGLDRVAGEIDLLEPLSRGLAGDRFARPLLLNYAGVVYMARAERGRAREHFEAAHAALGDSPDADLELAEVDMNLAMVTPERATREALAESAWHLYRTQLGPAHGTTLTEQCRRAHYLLDPAAARDLLDEASALYRQFHPDLVLDRARCASYQALITTEVGGLDARIAAAAIYDEIIELARDTRNPDIAVRGKLAAGYAALYRGQPGSATAPFEQVIAELDPSPNWWDQQVAAEARLGAGLVEQALADAAAPEARARHLARSAAHLERAADQLAGLIGRNEDVEPRQRLALARFARAGVLRRQDPRDPGGRAHALEAQAAAFYRDASPVTYRHRLAALPP
jgi:hypothetical protein